MTILDSLEHRLERAHAARLPPPDVEARKRLTEIGSRFLRWFSPTVRGLENVPATGPVLVVGNHSGLYYAPDVFVTSRAIADRRGVDAPIQLAAYDLLFGVPVLGDLLRRLGIVPADMGTSEQALRDGEVVLVYPGGDWEACRSWSERTHVDLAGHKGFIRLALRTGVPLVPVVANGSHDAVFILNRGDRIARFAHLERFRVKVFPIVLGLPWGLTTALLPSLPLPAAVTVQFLPPVDWSAYDVSAADDPDVVDTCYQEISMLMQRTLDGLRAADPHPLRRGCVELLRHGGHEITEETT